MDVLTPEQRHKNMSSIRSKNTKPELLVMKRLKAEEIYFTKHRKEIPGRPDIVFKRKKIAIFIDSDFWHCNPDNFRMPESNVEFWKSKFDANRKRDELVNEKLLSAGWKVLRLWESEIKKDFDSCIMKIKELIKGER